MLWRRADSSCWRSCVFLSGSDWELVMRYFSAGTPANGRTAGLADSSFLLPMAFSRTSFASFVVNDDCNKPRFASWARSSNAEGEDADADRGEDDNDELLLSFLSSDFFCDS